MGSSLCYCVVPMTCGESSIHRERRYGRWHHRPATLLHLNPAFIARKAEVLGFESIWYHEHPILPVDSASPFPATGGEIPWTYRHFSEPISLAMAAAVTSTIKLATGITPRDRTPSAYSRQSDCRAGPPQPRSVSLRGRGRLEPRGDHADGGDFEHRWTQAREAVMALKALWTQDEAEFHGRYYNPAGLLLSQTGAKTPSASPAGWQCAHRLQAGGACYAVAGCRTASRPSRWKQVGSAWTL